MYYIQWNQLCIMDTLGPLISVLIIKGVLFSRSDKASFGTITKCVDYAGVLISSVLIDRFHCSYVIVYKVAIEYMKPIS